MPAPNVKDAELIETKALPNGAASTYTDAFDLGMGSMGQFAANCELVISAPALVVGDLADAATMKYSVQMDSDSGFGSATTIYPDVITQTGAGGAGAAAATARVRLPTNCERYVRVRATNSASGDASDKSMTVSLVF